MIEKIVSPPGGRSLLWVLLHRDRHGSLTYHARDIGDRVSVCRPEAMSRRHKLLRGKRDGNAPQISRQTPESTMKPLDHETVSP